MTDYSKIYAEITAFRLRKQMSVSALARWVGVDHNVLRRTLAGETQPHDYNRLAIMKFYNDNVAKH